MQNPEVQPINFYNYVSPVTNLNPNEIKKIKKQEGLVKVSIGCGILIALIVLCLLSLLFYQTNMQPDETKTDNVNTTPIKVGEKPRDYADIALSSNYSPKTMPIDVQPYPRPEIDLLYMLYQKAYDLKWEGKLTTPLGFTYKDLNQQELNLYIVSSAKINKDSTIPKEKENLFYGDGAVKIAGYLKDSRNEYLKFVKDYGFAQKYIDELNNYVLPDAKDKIVYPATGGSINKPLEGDYSRKLIFIDPQDIYEQYLALKATIYGKKLNDADLVAASTRLVMYNQMGDAFMQAYINQHVTIDVKKLGKENMWLLADTNFMQYSTDYYLAWPYNKDVNDARFARGLMIKSFIAQYKLNDDQTSDFLDIVIQKDNNNINKLHDLEALIYKQYTDLLAGKWETSTQYFVDGVFAKYQGSKTQTDALNLILAKLNRIPRYVGYLNPMAEKDLVRFKN